MPKFSGPLEVSHTSDNHVIQGVSSELRLINRSFERKRSNTDGIWIDDQFYITFGHIGLKFYQNRVICLASMMKNVEAAPIAKTHSSGGWCFFQMKHTTSCKIFQTCHGQRFNYSKCADKISKSSELYFCQYFTYNPCNFSRKSPISVFLGVRKAEWAWGKNSSQIISSFIP